ncbi:MAG TPA: hypothetical protein IAC15_04595 [Candidatus Onthomonas avicola]|nr:hypothetical protein [Candidatus Onthomonas avicola]
MWILPASIPDDGPTAVYSPYLRPPEWYPVRCWDGSASREEEEVACMLRAHSGLCLVYREDGIEIARKCREPLTIFAVSERAYYALIAGEDVEEAWIGVICREDPGECRPIAQGLRQFLQMVICAPALCRGDWSSAALASGAASPEVRERRDALLRIFSLGQMTPDEWEDLCAARAARSPLPLAPP